MNEQNRTDARAGMWHNSSSDSLPTSDLVGEEFAIRWLYLLPAQTHGVAHNERRPMHLPPTPRTWASHLLATVTSAKLASEPSDAAAMIVYERLRRQLSPSVGVDGFRALASRALAQARSEAPRLSEARVTPEGHLLGFGTAGAEQGQNNELGVVLISHLLGLFLTFLGTATTLRLIEDVFPLLQAPSQPDTTTPFEVIAREVEQLKGVSDRLESLADGNPAVEDGLISISASVRDIATILDVFVVIKSRPEGTLLDLEDDASTGYLN